MGKFYSEFAQQSVIGKVREKNEDSLLIKIGEFNKKQICLFAVADGMGGFSYGQFASQTIINELDNWWSQNIYKYIANKNINIEIISNELKKLIDLINQMILNKSIEEHCQIGSTLSLVIIVDNIYKILHIGDSRVYLLSKNKITKLTKDQTLAQQKYEENIISTNDMNLSNQKNMLTNCVGVYQKCEPIFETSGTLQNNDIMLLCSDGFYEYVSEDDMLKILKSNKNINNSVKEMVDIVLKKEARDNISVIVFKNMKKLF